MDEQPGTRRHGGISALLVGAAVAFALGVAIVSGSGVAAAAPSESDTSTSPASQSASTAADRGADQSDAPQNRPGSDTHPPAPAKVPDSTDAAHDADDVDDPRDAHDEADGSDVEDAENAEDAEDAEDADASAAIAASDESTGLTQSTSDRIRTGDSRQFDRTPVQSASPAGPPNARAHAESPENSLKTVRQAAATPGLAISFSGVQLVQVGSASARTTGLGSLAIAWGENATASATGGWFNGAWALGADSVATVNTRGSDGAASGSFNTAFAFDGGNAGVNSAATGSGGNATVRGSFNSAWSFSGGAALVNFARADGSGATATAAGSFNTASSSLGSALVNDVSAETLSGTAEGNAIGSFNRVWARGSSADAEVNDVSVGASAGGAATASATGHSNTAASVGRGGGTVNLAQAQAGPGQATVLVSGNHNTAKSNTDIDDAAEATVNGAVVTDGASAVVEGSGNVATGDGAGGGTAFVNIVDALSAGSAGIARGNHNAARYTGSDNTVHVNVSFSGGSVGGNHNLARVWGTNSTATAGGGNFNAAIAVGDAATATAEGSCCSVAIAIGDLATATATGGVGNAAYVLGSRGTAEAGAGNHNLARIVGSGGTAQAGFQGDRNIASAIGDDSHVAAGYGKGNVAKLLGDNSYASAAAGNYNVSLAVGDDSRAGAGGNIDGAAGGNHNLAVILGSGSTAAAGLGRENTAIVLGNNDIADAGFGGNNNTVVTIGSLLALPVQGSNDAVGPPPQFAAGNPSPTDMTLTPYGDIGQWMLQPDGQIADWLGQPYEGKTMYEAINVIVVDPTSRTPQESVDRLQAAMAQAGFLSRQIHSGGYQGIVDGTVYSQQPTANLEAFSDAFFLLTNDHSRMFGPAPAAHGTGYVWITSASRETLGVSDQAFTHVYVSFEDAREALRGALVDSGAGTDLGLTPMDNKVDTATITTGDHDGYAAVISLDVR